MKKIGDQNGDFIWPMPLVEAYDSSLDSDYADMNNISSLNGAGSITAGYSSAASYQKKVNGCMSIWPV